MIKVENLSYRYPSKKEETLKNISFQVKKGEIFGFLGPSGAGKSTTQKILIGILKDYKGSVSVFNEELSTLGSNYYEKIGVAFEFPNFYGKLTAYENLKLFQRLYAGKTAEPMGLLKKMGLLQDAHVRFSNYSKGMKMRLNFCRALLNNPDLIFLDEPTSGLDPVNSKIMRESIQELKEQGKTIVLTTHNMHVADEICDKVAFMVDGQISLIESPNALKIQKGKKQLELMYLQDGSMEKAEFSLQGIGENTEFLQTIKRHEIITMHTQEATLEDIFIEVTGRKLQ
ncbi:ABC transporter ATP-binding protein [Bacillus salitolerans]|uniref:ABC transporter ATP-binding protein n=1 Tax=Bacillus salitolerans TaxID=1437434 RepID=A0ABW4LU19_9BACI